MTHKKVASAMIKRIQPKQYQQEFAASQTPHLLVDVRTAQEFAAGHIAGAVNIDVQTLPARIRELPTDRPVILYCRSGKRSATAAQILRRAGYNNVRDLGGILEWSAQGLPLA
jgi:rhodanese-related sulfurtransferase